MKGPLDTESKAALLDSFLVLDISTIATIIESELTFYSDDEATPDYHVESEQITSNKEETE